MSTMGQKKDAIKLRTQQEAEAVQRGRGRTIVAGMDVSEHADFVFDFICNNFDYADTTVVFVHVVAPVDAMFKSYSATVNEAQVKRYLVDGWVKRAAQLKKEFVCEGHVLTGDAREELMLFCDYLKPDALIMGSHGRGSLKRALLGSVSNYCVHHCACPVIIVKRPKEASEKEALYKAFFRALSFGKSKEECGKKGEATSGKGAAGAPVGVEAAEGGAEEEQVQVQVGEVHHGPTPNAEKTPEGEADSAPKPADPTPLQNTVVMIEEVVVMRAAA